MQIYFYKTYICIRLLSTTISNNVYLDLNGYTMACTTYNFSITSVKVLTIIGISNRITIIIIKFRIIKENLIIIIIIQI